jgi:acylphosphatase
MNAILLKITGKVQGVFFRSETKKRADELELKGWVKNCSDGTVEVFAQGDEAELNELEKWCAKGPPMAKVDDVKKELREISDCCEFSIRLI